jgi:hypothetical protein
MLGLAAFLLVVVIFLTVGSRAGTRTLGLVTVVAALIQLRAKRISYGWENREPSGYITGIPAIAISCFLGLFGVAMIINPDLIMAILGWE